MILCFGAELEYKGLSTFILSDNLALALQNSTIIEKKLKKDLVSGRVTQVQDPSTPSFSYLPLGLVLKHDRGWRKIYHLSHPRSELANDYISNKASEMWYTRFQEVLQLVTKASRHSIILKKDVKDIF